jgi:hypothetical protein
MKTVMGVHVQRSDIVPQVIEEVYLREPVLYVELVFYQLTGDKYIEL